MVRRNSAAALITLSVRLRKPAPRYHVADGILFRRNLLWLRVGWKTNLGNSADGVGSRSRDPVFFEGGMKRPPTERFIRFVPGYKLPIIWTFH